MTSPGTTGAVRLGRDTTRLLARLQPGDIAVLDHVDLDATTAQALVACGVGAVVNASPGTSGRYPNLGPRVLVASSPGGVVADRSIELLGSRDTTAPVVPGYGMG